MKKLFVTRHAKSSWDYINAADIDRPLNERGIKDAYLVSSNLHKNNLVPAIMITSPANRAAHTCLIFARELKLNDTLIQIDNNLYHPSIDSILDVLASIDNKHDSAMIFGHNPGFTDFSNAFNADLYNQPTAGCSIFNLGISNWSDVYDCQSEFISCITPKSLKG